MAGPSLIFKGDARPLNEVRKRVRKALANADTRDLLTGLGDLVVAKVMERFRTGTDPEGNKWPVSLRAKLEGGQTLVDVGNLRESYTRVVNSDEQVEIGSNREYAAIHHFGGVIRAKSAKALHFTIGGRHIMKKSVTIPARPALGLNDEDEAHLLEETEDWIAKLTRGIQ